MHFRLALGLWWIGGSRMGAVVFEELMSKRAHWEMGMMRAYKSTIRHIKGTTLHFNMDEGRQLKSPVGYYSRLKQLISI
jgi:hypothetical protein